MSLEDGMLLDLRSLHDELISLVDDAADVAIVIRQCLAHHANEGDSLALRNKECSENVTARIGSEIQIEESISISCAFLTCRHTVQDNRVITVR